MCMVVFGFTVMFCDFICGYCLFIMSFTVVSDRLYCVADATIVRLCVYAEYLPVNWYV